jgi:hypothetical protein
MAKESSAGISEQLKDLLAQSENQMKAIRDQIAEQWDAKRKAVTDLVDQQWDAQKKAVADLLEQQRKAQKKAVEEVQNAIGRMGRPKPS